MRAWDERRERDKIARQEEALSARAQWYRERTAAVKANVSAYDVLRHFGVRLKQGGSDREEQLSCPFHGKDNKPSARVYPDDTEGMSHLWCYTCRKRWDAIGLWKEFGGDPDAKFSRVLSEMERQFGLTPPEAPTWTEEETGPSEAEETAHLLFEACENRLREARPYFDLRGHLLLGQLLDKCRFAFEGRKASPEEVCLRLRQILDKIGAKMRGSNDLLPPLGEV